MKNSLRPGWAGLRDRFSSSVLGTTSPSVPGLGGGLSPAARSAIAAVAVALALGAGLIAGRPWGVLFLFPALMIGAIWGGWAIALAAWLACLACAAKLFGGVDLAVFAAASAVETGAALLLRVLFRESRRWGVRYRRLLAATSAAVSVSDAQGRIEWPQPELSRLIGMAWPAYGGTGWLKAIHPEDHGKLVPPRPFKDVPVQHAEIRLKNPATGDWRWHLMRAVPLLGEDGEVEEWISILTDVHARRLSGEQQEMMVGEARHRFKNLMAIIDALAKRSLPRDADAAVIAYQKKMTGRLHALAAASDLVLAGQFGAMDAGNLIAATLAPFLETESRRLTFGGPRLTLSESTGGAVALGIHELATNAIKHGALSVPEGRADLTWSVTPMDGGHRVEMIWKESGGPPPVRPAQEGFGTRVIAFMAAHEPNGSVTMDYPDDGYVCRIAYTLPAEVQDGAAAG